MPPLAANPYTNNPANEAQRRLIERLGGDVMHAYKLSKREASQYIDELRASAPAPAPETQQEVHPDLKPGVYETPDGIFVVKPNRRGTRLYAKKMVVINSDRLNEEGDHVHIEFEYDRGAVFNVRPEQLMDFERAKQLSLQYRHCIRCGRSLKLAKSVEDGMGRTCKKYFANYNAA